MMGRGRKTTPNTEIVGVFGDARYDNVRGQIPRQTFTSMGGAPMRSISSVTVYARTDRDPRLVMAQLREQVRRVDANFVISDMRTMDEQVNMRLSNERLLSFLSTGFALLATLPAVVGLYGVLAFVVIGIRMALGARQGAVVRLVLGETTLIVLLGVAAGVTAGILGGSYVESQLFGVKASDPAVFAVSVAALVAASFAAGFIPAWRASRIDPMNALRSE